MNHTDFSKLLSAGTIPTLLLFEGEEAYLKRKALDALRSAVLPAGFEELNETVLTAPGADEIISAAETLPFMADRRLIIVRDERSLAGRGEAEQKLLDYFPKIPDSAVLLFWTSQKPDGRKKLYTAIKKAGGIVTFSPLKDRELTSFVISGFRDLGKKCDERTAEYLVFTCGSDCNQLLMEIGKISSYRAGSDQVTADDVTLLATPSIECTVFQMVDSVVSRQHVRTLSLLSSLLLTGVDRLYILSMLLRQFRLLQHIKIMQYEKCGQDYMRSALGVPAFAFSQYLRQASFYTGGQLKRAVRTCLETEYAIKSGRLNQDGAVEAVILKALNSFESASGNS
ncbi:MAG: DNA polymerase III subunit delta [Clostridia bacterium]|nr:DNA polymerase III subunit delta [Clostridia bacterium]